MRINVGISEMRVTKQPGVILVTHSLGSCMGLAAYDPVFKVAGLIHCLLPKPSGSKKASENPAMCVSTGVPAMIREMYAMGAQRQNLILKAAGCSRMMNVLNQFNTGLRNQETLLALLEHNGLKLASGEMGGSVPRTMYLLADTGRVLIRSKREEREL
ncbi:chemotaxis protein CheD [Desulfonatronum sp. SC1]|uniref:chemotaxis protein CheD n=1 Tax=Desulfonatronum sp. SC1 TaxID=2109626 RepID=UPI000D311EE7|nr:chemotaxis protein CheD [Desulfonatronum sp. SC1]PTN37157.1 chemotaxis protein CheD [Desulfonatronum sp. SC1]